MSERSEVAVLLVNLGSPASYRASDIRRFLAEFLSDPRIVDLPRALWLPLLWGIILPFRPRRLVAKYRSIWQEGEAPIHRITRLQAAALQKALDAQTLPRPPLVAHAMTYGSPSIRSVLDRLVAEGITRVLVLPLFPQYSATTTGAVFDVVAAALKTQRNLPELRFVRAYHDHPAYIDALAESLGEWSGSDTRGHLLMSFHGIPQSQAQDGDPYPEQCLATARLLAERLCLAAGEWQASFQSRFGPAPWVTPYTDETLTRLAAEGTKRVTVICPGFAADCLETLEEIDEENRSRFLDEGGESFTYVPALNDRTSHIALLSELATTHLGHWCE